MGFHRGQGEKISQITGPDECLITYKKEIIVAYIRAKIQLDITNRQPQIRSNDLFTNFNY